MFTELDARLTKVEVPPEWSTVSHLAVRLHGFDKFRYDYRIVWKRKAFMFDATAPEFGMAVYRRDGTTGYASRPALIAECFDPEHACSVLRMLIVAEEDRETADKKATREVVNNIDKYFSTK
jgi:hypothetical protein